MLYYTQFRTTSAKIINDIENVIKAFMIDNYAKIGFNINMIDLVVFLLCFCSCSVAYKIMNNLYNLIIPSFLYFQNIRLPHGILAKENLTNQLF